MGRGYWEGDTPSPHPTALGAFGARPVAPQTEILATPLQGMENRSLLPRLRYIGDGVLFSIDFFVSLYLCLFVSLIARLRENGWTDLHEIFREGAE